MFNFLYLSESDKLKFKKPLFPCPLRTVHFHFPDLNPHVRTMNTFPPAGLASNLIKFPELFSILINAPSL